MEFLTNAWSWWQGNEAMVLLILGGILTVSLAVPGEQPDKALQWLVDMIKKFSRKEDKKK